jgi:hypothetical protein
MPPKAMRMSLTSPSVQRQIERAEHGGDVFVTALGDLVDGELGVVGRVGHEDLSTNSPGRRSCLP